MNQLDEAMDVANRAMLMLPKNPVSWARRGQVLRRRGEHQASVESYQRA